MKTVFTIKGIYQGFCKNNYFLKISLFSSMNNSASQISLEVFRYLLF